MVKITPLVASLLLSMVAAQDQFQAPTGNGFPFGPEPTGSPPSDAQPTGGFGGGFGGGGSGTQPSGGFGGGFGGAPGAQPTGGFGGGFGGGSGPQPTGEFGGGFGGGPGPQPPGNPGNFGFNNYAKRQVWQGGAPSGFQTFTRGPEPSGPPPTGGFGGWGPKPTGSFGGDFPIPSGFPPGGESPN